MVLFSNTVNNNTQSIVECTILYLLSIYVVPATVKSFKYIISQITYIFLRLVLLNPLWAKAPSSVKQRYNRHKITFNSAFKHRILGLAFNLLGSWGWPWTPVFPASTFQVLELQACITILNCILQVFEISNLNFIFKVVWFSEIYFYLI